jgi:hypothetical protein
MMPSPQVLPMPLDELELAPPPMPLDDEPLDIGHWQVSNERPSSLHVCTPIVPPRQAHDWVVPGTQPLLPLVFPPPFEPHAAKLANATNAPANHISLDRTCMFAPES